MFGSAALGLIRYAERRGVDVAPTLARHGVDVRRCADPDFRLSQGTYNALFAAFSRIDDCFGLHLAEAGGLEEFSLLAHLARRSSTFGEALERIARYSRIVHDAGRVETELQGERLIVYPGCRGLLHEYPRHVAEHAAASVALLGQAVLRRPLPVRSVAFRHPKPERTTEHARIFSVQPQFGAPETTVTLSAEVAHWPIPDADPSLASLLEHYAHDLLQRLQDETDIVARTEEAIARRLEDGAPNVHAIASALGVSQRTLQRRLAELETSFQQVLDSVRRSLAERYLQRAEVSVQEVAFLLGFSEAKNFHRAFRRWFGTTPNAWRRAAGRTTS